MGKVHRAVGSDEATSGPYAQATIMTLSKESPVTVPWVGVVRARCFVEGCGVSERACDRVIDAMIYKYLYLTCREYLPVTVLVTSG